MGIVFPEMSTIMRASSPIEMLSSAPRLNGPTVSLSSSFSTERMMPATTSFTKQ